MKTISEGLWPLFLLFGLWAGFCPRAEARSGSLDPAFDPGSGANAPVNSIALQSDGKMVIGGNFTQFNGTARGRVARLERDGRLDVSFDPGIGANDPVGIGIIHDVVKVVAVQSDGKILIGGIFSQFNGVAQGRLVRLNPDGSQSRFNATVDGVPAGASVLTPPSVNALAIQADGKILVGGFFTRVNGAARNGLARLDADGNLDSSFDAGFAAGKEASSVTIQSDGKVIINGTARLNSGGTRDTSFQTPNLGDYTAVDAVLPLPDGKILLGGQFGSFSRPTGYGVLARLNPDGTTDSSFPMVLGRQPGAGFGPDSVKAIALQNDGKIVTGGWLNIVSGNQSSGIARFLSDGTLDATFSLLPGVAGGSSNSSGPRPGAIDLTEVRSLAAQSDGNILIAGDFTKVNATPRNYVARLIGAPARPTSVSLAITFTRAAAVLSWPTVAAGFVLEQTGSLASGTSWATVVTAPVVVRDQNVVTVPLVQNAVFYRLRKP